MASGPLPTYTCTIIVVISRIIHLYEIRAGPQLLLWPPPQGQLLVVASGRLLLANVAPLKVELAKLGLRRGESGRKMLSQHKMGMQKRERGSRSKSKSNFLPGRSEPIVGEPGCRLLIVATTVMVMAVLLLLLLLLLTTVLGLGLVTVMT